MTREVSRRRRPGVSVAVRLTVWYAASAFTMIFAATAFLYWVLAANLEREDARFLADELDNVRAILRAAPAGIWRPSEAAPAVLPGGRELYVRIMDVHGDVLVETRGMAGVVPRPTAKALVASSTSPLRTGKTGQARPFQGLTATATGAQGPAAYVQVALNRAGDEQLLALYRRRLWWVLGLSLLASALVGYMIARTGLHPIRAIGRTAERIGTATIGERISTRGLPADLLVLAETFNSMLDRLEEAFARISRFSDDVAHELRTPIHNLRGEIEVGLSRARAPADYAELLGSCLEECDRLTRVINSLLFLARADSAAEPLQREVLDVEQELVAVADFYEAFAGEAGVELQVRAQTAQSASLNRTLFQQAVGNLVSNAVAHTARGGQVRIEAIRDRGGLHVTVADSGVGIPPEQLPYVFDRFFRGERSRTGSQQNVGLGLSVVKSIMELHGGKAEIASTAGHGTRVTLVFPASDLRRPADGGTHDVSVMPT